MDRLQDVLVAPPGPATVTVTAAVRRRTKGWSVHIFRGLADPAAMRPARRRGVGSLADQILRPAVPKPRRGRHDQVNAFGPRFADLYEALLRDTSISRHGHVALNETDGLRADPEGPVAWLPDLEPGGVAAAKRMAPHIVRLAAHVPVLAQVPAGRATARLRERLRRTPGVTLRPAGLDCHEALEGARGLLACQPASALEAFCCGIPVALWHELPRPSTWRAGLEEELAERVPVLTPAGRDLRSWAESPPLPGDEAWARDLLVRPRRGRNDAFAAQLRRRAVEALL